MSHRETVPCKFCGDPTPMLGTKLCDGCWEVSRRLEEFLRHPKAQRYALYLLSKQGSLVLATDDYGMKKLEEEFGDDTTS
jgi:hypothetical protein